MKIIFAGTPVFAERHLQALIHSDHEICAAYTQPDRPAGRGKKPQASAVKTLAITHNIPVLQPQSLKTTEAQAELNTFGADVMVVVAYGLILPKQVLTAPKFGCINVHGSILPRWRGAAPIQRAIEAGDTQSGVTIMQMDEGLDTGAMLTKVFCDISDQDSSADLHDRLAELGAPALLSTLALIEEKTVTPEQQDDSLSSYAKKIEKDEALINWEESAQIIDRKIRAFRPFPICYSFLSEQRVKIHRAHRLEHAPNHDDAAGSVVILDGKLIVKCGTGAVSIDEIQLPGKKSMSIKDYLNGIGNALPAVMFTSS